MISLQTVTVDEAMTRYAELVAQVDPGDVAKVRALLGIDIDKDPEPDIKAASGQLDITNRAGIALLLLALEALDSIDAKPGDGRVAFRQDFRYKLWGLIRGSGTVEESLALDYVEGQ